MRQRIYRLDKLGEKNAYQQDQSLVTPRAESRGLLI